MLAAFARMLAFIDPDCEKYLNSGGGNLQSYVSDLVAHDMVAVGGITVTTAAFTGSAGSDLDPGYAAMTFNTNGAFFTGTVAGTDQTLSVDNGRIAGGTAGAQVFVILHELAHGLLANGFENDPNNPGAQRRNNDRIDSNCKKTLASIK